MNAIGYIYMYWAVWTKNGAIIAPYKPNPYIKPIEVDWIYYLNAYVSMHAIKQFALTKN